MTHTYSDKPWRYIYNKMRQFAPENHGQRRTPRLGLADVALSIYFGTEYRLYIICDNFPCQRATGYWAEDLARVVGQEATFADLERRMVCGGCGQKMSGVRVAWSRRGEPTP